jgi:hypothetical protein
MPGAVYGGEDDLFALSVGDSTAIPEGGSIHLYESEQRGAIQVRFPGTRVVTERAPSAVSDDAVSQSDQEWVSSRSVREPEVAFRLFLNQEHVGAALLHMASRVWREVETVLPKDVPDLEEFRQEKLRYINRHVIKARGAARAIRPADDDRRKQPPPIIAGLGPYWSLLGARVFIQEGRRTGGVAYTDEGMSICDFFLKGKRPDGLIHDAYDPEKKHWGTLTASGFVSGVASLSSSAEAARHFLEIFAELRGSGVTRPELARLAGDTGDVLIDSRGDNGLWYESGEAALSTATVLTLLVRLESIRGRNSVRRTAIKQAASPFIGLLNTDSAVEQVASDRASLTTVCRAILDLGFYLRDDASLRAASEYAGLLASWVAAGGHSFPPGSRARKARLTTVGLVGCSKDRPHLGFDGLPVAYELARASKLTGHDQLASIAKAVCASTRQCLGGHSPIKKIALGAQPAELDITDWSSRRRNSRATGSLLGARVEQSIQAAFSATLLLEHYPDIANSR